MTPRFEVVELDAFDEWAIEVTWPDGRKQQLIGVYSSREAAKESLPEAARQFLVAHNN